jgi:protein involved in polysaccharide export with SLBB domain
MCIPTHLKPLALLCLAALMGWPAVASGQHGPSRDTAHRMTVDSLGDTIPIHPNNMPYKLLNGFPDYRVGSGDVLEVTIVEAGERSVETARISPDGTVSFNVLNRIPIAGLALSEAAELLNTELARYVRLPKLQVFVQEYASKTVSVLGSINLQTVTISGSRTGPGVYPLKGRISALDQLLESGGPASDARLDQVRLIRSNRTYRIDLQRAVEVGDNSQNPLLEDGDVIQVPGISQADRRVAVLGEVNIAGVFNLSTQANLLEAIAATKGFTQAASANRVRIIRPTDPANPEVITVNAERIFKGDLSQNIGLEDGDIIVVPRDWLTDMGDLIAQISPILAWGGLVQTEPVVTVGGYSSSYPGGSEAGPAVGTTAGGQTTSFFQQPSSAQTQTIQQIQQNLQKPAR